MSEPLAVDTSIAVPLLVDRHPGHGQVTRWARGRTLALSGHAAVEAYSVLTRLPQGLQAPAADVARVIRSRFGRPYLLDVEDAAGLVDVLGDLGVIGGAVYDALVGLAAARHDVGLATQDRRALPTYRAVGARVVLVG